MSYDKFDGVYHISYPSYGENIYENFHSYLNWSLLQIGAFQNVRLSGYTYGDDPSRLRSVSPTVWEGPRRGWVWESGVYQVSPIHISGVWVNSNLVTSGYQINYREGQVLFNSPVSGSVCLEYSYRMYDVYNINTEKWFKDIIYGDWVGYSDYLTTGSGAFDVLSKNRVNLPFIGIEVIPRRNFKPFQLGGGQYVYQDVQFWIVGENYWQVSNCSDWISFQNDKIFKMFNIKYVQDDSAQTYKYDGTLNSGLTYKQLVDNYFWKTFRTTNTEIQEISTYPLFINTVRMTLESIFEELP